MPRNSRAPQCLLNRRAAPAAMRVAVPEANPSLSLTASLGVTFPFNIFIGIPIYYAIASALHTN